jgi:uncharacterized protein YukE
MADVIIGSPEWYADLAQFGDTISTISGCKNSIEVYFSQIQEALTYLEGYWQSPAGSTYSDAQQALSAAGSGMIHTLGGILDTMNTTMQNYQLAEQDNTSNFS